ncbi:MULTISPECIES: Holliday junction resolvase RuvX [Janthinobacterium]|uniref:Putative pre-16S rRNA nuclease n=2 Tax=Janthinobacterium TaxID=29580 RepID=A0A1S1UI15_9BURK|nr:MULTISPECIES: Holliday junction resolvase RuvX [Janthinobacterium]KAB8057988.1 Holliday junction resolvase RuvX [Janthinobacterium sp. FT14W]KAB8063580.1 Holliday junction resolvase RuvX [Janthinobacterium violaceinigrum]MCC7646503.1 Holliday junction resolvase RuvX [Janthinobacterium sp. EB271-G4-3-1]MCC7694885.1 Holliday junction resolvase RuvX [Janthinobacterium sp. EB271-G4-3-2]PHV21498.1 Holliday junction resolvase RuvX [Janthinobacterium sp. BJB446]TSD74793.1 Holliday junction resolv
MDTILAFDFGLKRIGVAIGNTMICQAKPLSVITATANEPKFAAIDSLIKEWGASRIVVGLPSHPDGTEHEMSARCRRFANQVHGRFNLPVELVDERYSSAVIAAKRGEVIDDRAAAIILQQYFDANY